LLKRDDILAIFHQAKLVKLVDDLSKPMSHYIVLPKRKIANNLLKQIYNRDKKNIEFLIRRHSVKSVTTTIWPSDIIGLADLKESMSEWIMRSDVAGYLETFLENTLPGQTYKISFVSYRSDISELQIPIKIEVDSQCSDTLRAALATASEGVGQDALTPVDVVQVVGVDIINKNLTLSEEGCRTSGSPW